MISAAEPQFVIVLAIIAVHFVFREAVFERAQVRNNDFSFPPVLGLRIIFWFGIPIFLFAAHKVCGQIQSRFDLLYPVLFIALASLAFFSYPATISFTSSGINLRRYLGLRVKRMKWEGVAVVSSRRLKTISVYAHDGESIVHTQFNVEPARFKSELGNRLPSSSIIEQ